MSGGPRNRGCGNSERDAVDVAADKTDIVKFTVAQLRQGLAGDAGVVPCGNGAEQFEQAAEEAGMRCGTGGVEDSYGFLPSKRADADCE